MLHEFQKRKYDRENAEANEDIVKKISTPKLTQLLAWISLGESRFRATWFQELWAFHQRQIPDFGFGEKHVDPSHHPQQDQQVQIFVVLWKPARGHLLRDRKGIPNSKNHL
jgi:hypothetical protein